MKSIIIFLTIASCASVYAQEQCASLVAKIPQCAIQCIDKAAAGVGCSDPKDLACQCKNTDAINAQALQCVLSGCGASQGLEAQSAASAVCKCVASAGSSPSSAEATSSAEPSESTTEAAASTEASSTSAASSTSPPYPTASQVGDGQVQAGTGSPSAGSSPAPTSSAAPFTGAGARADSPIGVAAMAALGALLAL